MTQNNSMLDNIKKFAKTIKHTGDYGILFFNSQTSEIWWVASDGDGLEANTTLIKDIEFGFSNITGITKVYVELEAFPIRPDGDPYEEYDEDEEGWIPNPWIELDYNQDLTDSKHTCDANCNHDTTTNEVQVQEVKEPVIGKFKPKREFLNFVVLKRGGIRYHTDTAFLKVEQISGMLEEVILKFTICDEGTINVEETDTNLCSDEMIQRFVDEIDSRDVTGYSKKYVVYGLEFLNQEGGKLYLEVNESKPIDKLSSLFDELKQEKETNMQISENSLSILDALFGDDVQEDKTSVETLQPVDEEIETSNSSVEVVEVQETYAQKLIRESFEEMNREKVTELTERVEKKEKDIKSYKQLIKQHESSLVTASDDLRVLQTRLDSLKPADPLNGYAFFVSTENKTDITLDKALEDVVEKIAPILKLNKKAVIDFLTNGYFTIKLAKKDNLTDENLQIDKEILKKVLNLDVTGKVSIVGYNEFEYRGDLNWHQIVDKLIKMGFEQEPEFDKICGSNSYESLEEDTTDMKKSIMDMAKNIGIEDFAKQHIKDIETNQDNQINMTSPIKTISEFTEPTTIVIFGDSPNSSIQITDDEACFSVIIGNKVTYELGSSGFADVMTLDEYKNYYKQNKSMLEDCEGLVGGIVIPNFVGKVGITAFNKDGATGNFNLNDFILHQLDYELDYQVGIVLPEGTISFELNSDCSLPLDLIRDEKINSIL